MNNIVQRGIQEIIRWIVLANWAVLGMLFWIPLLARMTAAFTGAVIASAFTNTDLKGAEVGLDRATKLYVVGFQKINNVIDSLSREVPDATLAKPMTDQEKTVVFLECGFALAFWIVTVIAVISFLGGWSEIFESIRNKTK